MSETSGVWFDEIEALKVERDTWRQKAIDLEEEAESFCDKEKKWFAELREARHQLAAADKELNEFAECIAVNKGLTRLLGQCKEALTKIQAETFNDPVKISTIDYLSFDALAALEKELGNE